MTFCRGALRGDGCLRREYLEQSEGQGHARV